MTFKDMITRTLSLILPCMMLLTASHAEERTDAFRHAKFGMFITWGLYSIPADGEWVMSHKRIPVAEYAGYTKQFNPVKFNAGEWVRIAKDAGMKYIVITAKHHDGFALYDSKASPFNIVAMTPFKRDPLKELAEACRKEGIALGFYYSQAQDWHHPGGGSVRKQWDPAQKGDFDEYLKNIAMPQLKELLTGYGPVFSIWFDTPVKMTPERAEKLVKLVHETQPATVVNSRVRYHGAQISGLNAGQLDGLKQIGVDYLSYRDRQIPDQTQWRDWETCMTLNESWGFTARDNHWKSPEVLIRQLIDIASKGGNYLLNVGPTAEGVIPEPSVRNLKLVGDWLKVNGEAIYGTEPGNITGQLCTSKPGRTYVHLLKWPGGRIELAGLKNKVTKAYLLSKRDTELTITQTNDQVTVTLPEKAPDAIAYVLCLEHSTHENAR